MRRNTSPLLVSIAVAAVIASGFAGPQSANGGISGADKAAKATQGKPLKVFILAGQSNMQGQAMDFTIPRMALSPESKWLHDRMLDADGRPRVHTNIYITAISQQGGWGKPWVDKARHGNLTVGYGNDLTSDRHLGPELGFGVTMGELVGEPILIIKTAWGGKSLAGDFRPPSAGIVPLSADEIKQLQAKGTYEETLAKRKEWRGGKYYNMMMAHINEVLAAPGKFCPAYDPKQGYEIDGFGWFQGYNDKFAGGREGRDKSAYNFSFYSELLGQFIRDVRKDLNAPKMPFAIGVIGIEGNKTQDGLWLAFREAMAAPAEWPEFKGNVIAVNTADFWDDEMVTASAKAREAGAIWKESEHWKVVGKTAPDDRIWHYTSFDLDPKDQYRALEKGENGDERTLTGTVPDDMKGWLEPGFDTSKWQKGPAPIGKGESNNKKEEEKGKKEIRSPWGDGNMLLMRTTFELNPTDFARYRLRIKSTRSFLVYLNGHIIKSYPWWKGDGFRVFDLGEKQTQYFKQGSNVLAFYGNIEDHKGRFFNAVDLMIEGISQEQLDDIQKQQDAVCTPRDIALSRGSSNQSYHYMGSAYTYSLIGEALAKAIHEAGR